jgi:hypothetical protein
MLASDMYLLAEVFPFLRRVKLPFSRDQFILLLAAFNLFVLGLDTYLAHDIDGAILGNMWIPIIFGPAAGAVLLAAGLVAIKRRMVANALATLISLACFVVAVMGSFFHLYRGLLPDAPAGQTVTAVLLVYAPPLLSPATFALVGLLAFSAAWEEQPAGSGKIQLLGQRQVRMPYPKTQAYFFMTGMFVLATVISSVLDHARTNFVNPWLWLPTFAGMFAVVVCCAMGAITRLTKGDLVTYMATMLLLVGVGLIGAILHLEQNITEGGALLGERFLRGAPMLAPLLFANMGLLGLLALLDPKAVK